MLEPVAVYWLDASGARDDADVVPSVTMGFLVEMTEDKLKMASEAGTYQDGRVHYSDITAIPRGMVLQVLPLRKILSPDVLQSKVRKRGRAKS